MSHFAVLVITSERPTEDVLARTLAPYHEFECTGRDDQYVVDVDRTQEVLAEYAKSTEKMIAAPDGVTFYGAYEDRFYRDPTPEETAKIGPLVGSGGGHGMSWSSRDWGDGLGYRTKVHEVPADHKEIDVPTRDVQQISQWAKDYYGASLVTIRAGESDVAVQAKLDRAKEHKYGYALVSEAGDLIKLVRRTNPKKKWDWYQIGGRFTGMFRPHYDPNKDPENQEKCFLCHGTGKRSDTVVCNGCRGTGVRTKWPTQWRSVGDVVQVKDLPLITLRDVAEREALKKYDRAHTIIAGREALEKYDRAHTIIAGRAFPSWRETRERIKDIDTARSTFHDDPVMVDLRAAGFDFIWVDEFLDGLRQTRPEHATRARRRAVQTFAVIKDGSWYERGEMGWWGCVHNEKDADKWDEEFEALLDGLAPETWLAIVDCHI